MVFTCASELNRFVAQRTGELHPGKPMSNYLGRRTALQNQRVSQRNPISSGSDHLRFYLQTKAIIMDWFLPFAVFLLSWQL